MIVLFRPRVVLVALLLGAVLGAAALLGLSGRAAGDPAARLAGPSAPETASATVSATGGVGLVLRAGPGTGEPRLARLPEGTRVQPTCWAAGEAVRGDTRWLRATTGDRTGWLAASYLDVAGAVPAC